MNQVIHQVYGVFDDGVRLQEIPTFHQQVEKTKAYCDKYNITYKMWDKPKCDKLIAKYPHFKEFYYNMREPVQRADFIRYLILYDEGGMYVDCDIAPIGDVFDLFEMNEFFVIWSDDKKELPYNAVLGSVARNPIYVEIFNELIKSYNEKVKNKTYETWKGRFVFQTTGHHMLNRVLKKYPYAKKLDILKIYGKGGDIIGGVCPIFEDYNESFWFKTANNYNTIIK
jgi:mannosyltransferase OCH1-like enzyme